MEVLGNPQYAKAAKAMSVKIRARKNTPVQEAAGEDPASYKYALPALICLPYSQAVLQLSCVHVPPGQSLE